MNPDSLVQEMKLNHDALQENGLEAEMQNVCLGDSKGPAGAEAMVQTGEDMHWEGRLGPDPELSQLSCGDEEKPP